MKSYADLKPRQRELYDCTCPPERPCTREQCQKYREYYDAVFAGTMPDPDIAPLGPIRKIRIRPGPTKPPRWYRKVWTFIKALYRHIRHGLPIASAEDVGKRAAICGPCEYNQNGECVQCGCGTNPARKLVNKLKWAEQQCPLLGNRPGPWWGPVRGQMIFAFVWERIVQFAWRKK